MLDNFRAPPNLIRSIDLTTLRLFIAICEEGGLTRAATREAIAPSAVSKRLSDLEETLGASLFVRMAKGMILTGAGELVLHHARVAFLHLEELATEINDHSHGIRGRIRMLANLSAIVAFLPADLSSFFRHHNFLRFNLEERPSRKVVRGIEDGVADIGICSSDVETRDLETFDYRCDKLVIIARTDHPLAGNGPINFADTLDFDHVGLHAASSIYLRLQYAAGQAGRSIRLRIHVPGFDAVCRMVQSDMGIAIIPDRVFDAIGDGMNLTAIHLLDNWATRQLKIIVQDSAHLSPACRLILHHLRYFDEAASRDQPSISTSPIDR